MERSKDVLSMPAIIAIAAIAVAVLVFMLYDIAGPFSISGLAAPTFQSYIISQAPAPGEIPNLTQYSVGYIGCQNAQEAVQGYYSTPGNQAHLWQPYNTGAATLAQWANTSSDAWTLFGQEVQVYGTPKAVWFDECINGTAVDPTKVADIIAILRTYVPSSTPIYITPLNFYNPTNLCPQAGANGVNETVTYANYVVGEGLADYGPILGPLNASTVQSDGCHPNQTGEALLGRQLRDFFG